MKKMLVSVVAAASLAIPMGWVTAASASPSPDPDHNGDVHSNCHTGSKFRGAGGEDRVKNEGKGDPHEGCPTVTPPTPPAPPVVNVVVTPTAAPTPAAAPAAAPRVAAPVAPAAVAVQAAPRTTG
jgi:hypothetical protein